MSYFAEPETAMRIYSTEDIDLDNTDIDPEQW